MADFDALKTAFAAQAAFCRNAGSPTSALALEAIAGRLGEDGPFDAFLAPWAEASVRAVFDDAAPLRLLGAFHYIVMSGRAPGLAALYADPEPDPAALGAALVASAEAHGRLFAPFMASPPQTNEVARSLALVGGFLTVAADTRLPLRCLELGASAGLNMNWSRFGYRFGDSARWGDLGAPVQLFGQWTGGSPPTPAVEVIEVVGCDQNPIDVLDDDAALRLQSYVWAGQALRLQRIRGAIALKRETGGVPVRADAGAWSEDHVRPAPGMATVVYHSVFFQYPPEATRARIRAAIEAAGAAATPEAPMAWLRMEPDPANIAGPMEVRLTQWPGGEDRLLAQTHPHGSAVTWLG
jgi:hypothetical protein